MLLVPVKRAGQEGGSEAAVHAIRDIFSKPVVEGVLLVLTQSIVKQPYTTSVHYVLHCQLFSRTPIKPLLG